MRPRVAGGVHRTLADALGSAVNASMWEKSGRKRSGPRGDIDRTSSGRDVEFAEALAPEPGWPSATGLDECLIDGIRGNERRLHLIR